MHSVIAYIVIEIIRVWERVSMYDKKNSTRQHGTFTECQFAQETAAVLRPGAILNANKTI